MAEQRAHAANLRTPSLPFSIGSTAADVDRVRAQLARTIVVIFASAVMLVFVNSRSVWLDEASSIAIASEPFSALLQTLGHVDAVHGLYYLLLHVWLMLGQSAIAVRLLSVVFAVIAIVYIITLAAELFGEEAALATGTILGTSTFVLFYADEARSITLTLMMCAITALHFWRGLASRSMKDLVFCAAFATIAVYASVLSALFLAGLVVSLIFLRLDQRTLYATFAACVAVGAATLPLGYLIALNSVAQIDWIAQSGPAQIAVFAVNLLGGESGVGRVGRGSGLLEAGVVLGLMAAGFAAGWRKDRTLVLVVSTWFAVPLVLSVLVDRYIHPVLVARYFPFVLIGAALLAGNGLVQVARRTRPVVAYALIALLAAVSIHGLLTVQREDWRSVTRFVAQHKESGDGLVFWAPVTIEPFTYAAHEIASASFPAVAYPATRLKDGVEYPRPDRTFGRRVSRRFSRVWIIQSHDLARAGEANPAATLSRFYTHWVRRRFPGIDVLLYSR